jgi:hypothetical protein
VYCVEHLFGANFTGKICGFAELKDGMNADGRATTLLRQQEARIDQWQSLTAVLLFALN